MQEIKLTYNRADGKYYIYDGDLYISDCNRLIDALQYFLPLITNDVQNVVSDRTWMVKSFGKRVIYVKGDE